MEPNPSRSRPLVGLPLRPFLYSIDQIATLLALNETQVKRHMHFDGKNPGKCPPNKMLTRNINKDEQGFPQWRVAEAELIRWLRTKGYRFYERGYGVN